MTFWLIVVICQVSLVFTGSVQLSQGVPEYFER